MYGLYIHIPFCIKKCRYCDFISYPDCNLFFDEYINALLEEAKKYQHLTFDTVFIGGGTPTILSEVQLFELLNGLKSILNIKENAEFSVESNPKTLTREKLSVLSENGVNRLSIGVQSFCDDELKFLGRVHSADDAKSTILLSKEYFNNINIDLMFALPYQTKENVLYSLNTALSLNPTHLSCYSLIIEEGTPIFEEFEKGNLIPQDEDTDRDNFEAICKTLSQNGFSRYEISNFSLEGFECKHNLKYWNCDEYIGIGVGAHSYYNRKRFYNTSDLQRYIKRNYSEDEISLTDSDMMSEFMIMGLRKTKGISLKEFKNRFSINPYDIYNIEDFENKGLIINNGENIFLSERGLDVSNSILCEFV